MRQNRLRRLACVVCTTQFTAWVAVTVPAYCETGYWASDSIAIGQQGYEADRVLSGPQHAVGTARTPLVAIRTSYIGGLHGAQSVLTTYEQPLRRPSVSPPTGPLRAPFVSASSRQTISPYLSLFREENDAEVVPNYFTYVRPQLEQQESNRRQEQELASLRQQVQAASTTIVMPQHGTAGAAGVAMGRRTPARYGDTAQFYGGWQRQ